MSITEPVTTGTLHIVVNALYADQVPADASGYGRDADATDVWCFFYKALLNKEAVELPGIGYAYYADADVESKNYWEEGDIWFVFKVTQAGRPDRFFRRSGYYSSYGGREFDGGTTEVTGRQVIKTEWSEV